MILQRDGRHRLELGCGRLKHSAEFIGVDRLPLTDEEGDQVPDVVWDLDRDMTNEEARSWWQQKLTDPDRFKAPTFYGAHWLFAEDSSCSFIIAHQTLEHIHNLIPFMNEVHRIADDNSWFEVIVPYYKSPAAFQDPTHVRFFTEMTLRYWEPGMVDGFSDYGIKGYFGLAAQRWREDGNLWALLRPLKTAHDLQYFKNWQSRSEQMRPEHPMRGMCPVALLARYEQHNFLGGPD